MSLPISSDVREEPAEIGDAFVHLARLALSGREQDVSLFVQRAARKFRRTNPATASALTDVLRDNPSPGWPLRGVVDAPMPVDMDSRLPLFRVVPPDADQRDPILTSAVKGKLTQLVDERHAAASLLEADLVPARGALFTGPPGVGKTMGAQWVASRLGLPLVVLDLSTVMSSLLGKTGANLRNAFDYAKRTPCVLLLDELDAVAKKRNDDSDVGELKRLVTVLLQQLDDWPSAAGLIVAATNHPELLDPAVWRRFDMAVAFGLPDETARREAVRRFSRQSASEELINVLAAAWDGWSFNDIERELLSLRRKAVLAKSSLVAVFFQGLENLGSLPHEGRMRVALALAGSGLASQRQISEITGVARDTIRRHLKSVDERS